MASNTNHFLDGPGLSRVWSKIKSYVKGNSSLVGAKGTIGTVKNNSSITSATGYTACPIVGGVPYYKDTNNTYSLVGAKNTTGLVKNGSGVTVATGYTPCPIIGGIPYYQNTDTIYSTATENNNGLMTSNQVRSLNNAFQGVSRSGVTIKFQRVGGGTEASVTLPNAALNTTGVVKTTSQVTSAPSSEGYAPCPIISGIPYYKNTNTTYTAATASASGLMTAAQFKKLSLSGECIGTKKGAVTGTSYVNSATHNSSGNWIALGSGLTFGPGVWLLIVTAIWASSSTGRRGVSVASGESTLGNVNLREDVCAATGGQTHNRVVTFVDGDASYIIGAYQSSGGSTTVSINYSAVRVG